MAWDAGQPLGPIDLRISVERPDGSAVTLWSSLHSGLAEPRSGEAILELPELALSGGSYVLHLRVFADGLLHDEVRHAAKIDVGPAPWQGLDYPTPRPMALQVQRWS